MSFPTAIPSYNPTSGTESANSAGSGTGLSGLLNAFETDITALGTKMGTGASTPAANKLLVGTGPGTSGWQGLSSAELAAILSDETGSGAVVFANSPTIITPTIASFANANHDHTNSAGGGQLGTSALANGVVTADKLASGAKTAVVATAEATSSTSYTDLTTTSDSVTVTIGANGLALVIISGLCSSNASGSTSYISFAASSANTIAASDTRALTVGAVSGLAQGQASWGYMATALTPGSTVFKLKYKASTGTTTFSNRNIVVIPL